MLLATVAAALLPAVLFQPHSRIFMLKLAAVALFASSRGVTGPVVGRLDGSWQVAHGSLAGFRIQETAGAVLQVGEMGAEPPVGLCGQMG